MRAADFDWLLFDIEGTTTKISFVHDVLFPYSRRMLPDYIRENLADPEVQASLLEVKETMERETGGTFDLADASEQLLRWIDEDRKHPALKRLQGKVWRQGYESGAYQSHVYPDVKPAWERWQAAGKKLAIFSSGSVAAQKLLFAHTTEGDLNPLLDAYFDLATGSKKEALTYSRIAETLGVAPERILFLSDIAAELDAATSAGVAAVRLVRPGTEPGSEFPEISSFTELY